MPELENIATGKEPRPRELDQFATNFAGAGEKQEKARAEFDRAQKAEERFHNFTRRSATLRALALRDCISR